MAYKIGILGATGAVGQELIRLLHERNFPIAELRLLASARSAGKTQTYGDKSWTIQQATPDSFEGLDVCIFSAGASQSKLFGNEAVRRGCIVIDNSSAFRMDAGVPLVVPEINPDAAFTHQGIIANPNCSTIITLMGLYPLHLAFGLKSIIASTYQAVSGSGAKGIIELEQQARAWAEGGEMIQEVYPHQIAFNLLPHVDAFLEDGYTKEEWKVLAETKKMLDPKIKVTCTAVRVPVFIGHSESVNIEFENEISAEEARDILRDAPGCQVIDKHEDGGYITPYESAGEDATYISRIREDQTLDNGLNIWVVADNLRKGAALNTVQIAELLVNRGLLKQRDAA